MRSRLDLARLALVAAAAAPVLVILPGAGRMVMPPMALHFWLVVTVALISAGSSVALTVAGARSGDGRAMLLGTAFSTMSALFAVHGMATPGILVGDNGIIAAAGGLAAPVGAFLLALTALPALRRPRRVAPLIGLQVGTALAVIGFGLLGLLDPAAVPAVPAAASFPAYALMALGDLALAVLVIRAVRTHLLTHRMTDGLVAVGCVWLAWAQWGQLIVGPMTLAFFLGHGLEISAVALIGIPAAIDLHRHRASRPLTGDLSATELVAAEEAYLGPRVRSLLVALADRDRSTEAHTRRVALLAAAVAEELKLPASARRDLAMGGLLHDIGKLSVPLEILNKPGALEDHEFAAIKRHPGAGRALLEELGGFPEPVLRLVSDHHERLDGKGYPRGLTAGDLDLQTRVLTACDVYDALVSDRVYRSAWTPERALELLHTDSGSAFDPAVVAALERVVSGGPAVDAPAWVARLAEAATPLLPPAGPARRPA